MSDPEPSEDSKPATVRSIEKADAETKRVSSQVLDIIDVEGKVSEPGPRVTSCSDKNAEKFFKMLHPWSLTGTSNEELRQAMTRLRENLPKKGWKIVGYGRNNSKDKSLELTADNHEKRFGLNVELWEEAEGSGEKPKLIVNVVSGCYRVPEGETVDRY
ncbi:hypothetical protein ACWGJ2_28640 [Streptomyces sp. NPDC054796]